MDYRHAACLIGIVLLACAQPATDLPDQNAGAAGASGFNYESYASSSIEEAIRENPSSAPGAVVTISPVGKYRTIAMVAGEVIPLRSEIRDVIENWALDVGADKESVDLFQHELIVSQDGSEFRLLVQEPLLHSLRSEVPGGASAEFFGNRSASDVVAPGVGFSMPARVRGWPDPRTSLSTAAA